MEAICKLTGSRGKFIKAHIIPDALTKPSIAGEHFIQAGQGERPIKRWTSWYDPNLVTKEGESILRDLDDWAIEELRSLKLVWSSWQNSDTLGLSDWMPTNSVGHGCRIIPYENSNKLRLFLLSLLWRAAASDLSELSQIRMPKRQLRRLGKMLLSADSAPNYLFPVCLVQLTSLGPRHNLTPMALRKPMDIDGSKTERIFRFYFDGLIVHFHRDFNIASWREMGGMAVGASDNLVVVTVPYEASAQNEMLEKEASKAESEWLPDLLKLARPPKH